MTFDARILAFLVLLIVQVLVSIVYKFSQTKGTYTYSPLSVIASAEFVKLCISSTLLLYSASTDEITTTFPFGTTIYSRLSVSYTLFQQEVRKTFIHLTFGLALLYVINNQLAFILYLYVDIASISMFKSFSSFASAILLWAFFERNMSREQWCLIILQVTGLCIVQYDSCQNRPFLAFKYYAILVGSTLITSICSVWNERLIKTYSVNIHIQNAVLYSFGLMLNLALFFFLPSKKHFFEGYSLSVYAIILCNSLLGIVITFVYKYADVIVKTFSTACATGVLLYINVTVFKLKANLTVFLGATVIFVSSYLFLLVKPTPTISSTDPDPVVDATSDEKNKWTWTQNFGWKYRLISIASVSLVFYFIASLSRNGTVLHSTNNFYVTKTISLPPNIICIEEIHPNRSVVIHGVNLCPDKTLNATRVLINSHFCFPIEICSNTVLSCYLQGVLNNQSFGDTMNINLTTSAEGLSISITIKTTKSCTNSLGYWKKNDIVLVIHFNQPNYERISFLSIYRDIFPLVLFTGNDAHPDVIQCPDARMKGYECLSQALSLHPNHTGYLMAHFDVLPIFYRLEDESLTSFWISQIGCVPLLKADGWAWWSPHTGLEAMKKVFDEIKVKANVQNTSFYGRYASNYEKHAGQGFCNSFSDIFYMPQQFISDWLILTELFVRHAVFHEIAFASLTYMIIPGNLSVNLEILEGEYFGSAYTLEYLNIGPLNQFIHRIDLTAPSQRQIIEIVVNRSFATTIN